MKAPMARSSRASAPFSTTKRAPEIFAAVAKSMRPNPSPISKCCFTAKSSFGGAPTRRTSTLSCSSLPSGTSSRGRLGMTESASRSLASSARSSSSPLASSSFSAATSAISSLALASSLAALALPISFETALRRACASCSRVTCARRASSSAISSADCGARPRFFKPASNASGLSLIHLMSNTSAFLTIVVRSAPIRHGREGGHPRKSPQAAKSDEYRHEAFSDAGVDPGLRRDDVRLRHAMRNFWGRYSGRTVDGPEAIKPRWTRPVSPPAGGLRARPPRSTARRARRSAASWPAC